MINPFISKEQSDYAANSEKTLCFQVYLLWQMSLKFGHVFLKVKCLHLNVSFNAIWQPWIQYKVKKKMCCTTLEPLDGEVET